jgi:sec-independent protein translocase protein TatB
MFSIGGPELIVILLVALIVLGPKNLAGIARTVGKTMGEFRRISTDFQRTLNAEAAQEDEAERKKRAAEAAENATPPQPESPHDAAATQNQNDPEDTPKPEAGQVTPPPGSPLAEAVAKAGAEAADTKESAADKPAQGQS